MLWLAEMEYTPLGMGCGGKGWTWGPWLIVVNGGRGVVVETWTLLVGRPTDGDGGGGRVGGGEGWGGWVVGVGRWVVGVGRWSWVGRWVG